jgi:2-polyprenyl-3-methyl-5-hydroxy-6-metoxy-1,4-benzoquinol methylase
MDDIARYNKKRWKALAKADALFTRPLADLDVETARRLVAPYSEGDQLLGKRVLCLAGGGGQQSAAFALLGADVTVVDLSEEQLARDRAMAAHYQVNIKTIQGDMRDLSMLEAASFDIVDQPYSLNFVPDARVVFGQVARIMRMNGRYDLMCANPFAAGLTERDWNGQGYSLKAHYMQGERMTCEDQDWVYDREGNVSVPPPQEFRQTLSTLVNGLAENGFVIRRLLEAGAYEADIQAEPGTWDHFSAVIPPWLFIHALYRPDMFF